MHFVNQLTKYFNSLSQLRLHYIFVLCGNTEWKMMKNGEKKCATIFIGPFENFENTTGTLPNLWKTQLVISIVLHSKKGQRKAR